MKHILHLVSGEGDHVRLAEKIIELEEKAGDRKITVIRLQTDPAQVDYRGLLQAIFAADSIHTW